MRKCPTPGKHYSHFSFPAKGMNPTLPSPCFLTFGVYPMPFAPSNISNAHLETAKMPPFIDPKQERATNTGTAKEKFPISRSAKVC